MILPIDLLEARSRPSVNRIFVTRIVRTRNAAGRKAEVVLSGARERLARRADSAPLSATEAARIARSVSVARLNGLRRGAFEIQMAARRMASDSLHEEGAALRLPAIQQQLWVDDTRAIDSFVAKRLEQAEEAIRLARGEHARLLRERPGGGERVRTWLNRHRLMGLPTWAILNEARVHGALIAGARAGVKEYRFVAKLDQHTTVLCRSGHGRRFTAKQIRETATGFGVFDTGSPAPSGRVLKPPLHHRCRSRLVPVK